MPRRFAGGPEVVEHDGVLVRVHAVPEALVAERAQLALGGKPLERRALEHAVGLEIGERGSVEAEEAAVGRVVADFRAALPDAVVYVYDNNSKDRTAAVAAPLHAQFPGRGAGPEQRHD